jgi:hypothetical protein
MSNFRRTCHAILARATCLFHRIQCHPIVEIAQHAIPHPELHLACWAVALLCRVAGHGRRWAKPIERIARMLGGDE